MRVVIKRRDLLSQLFTTVHDVRRRRYPNVGRRRRDRRHNISTLVVGHASRCAVPGIFIRLTTHDAKLLPSQKNKCFLLLMRSIVIFVSVCVSVCLSTCLSALISSFSPQHGQICRKKPHDQRAKWRSLDKFAHDVRNDQ